MDTEQTLLTKIERLELQLAAYENNGPAKLYYSLNRKMNEMADIMNKHSLVSMSLDDAKDKTFERMRALWGDAATIATSVEALKTTAGITGDEQKDVSKKPFVTLIAEDRK